jgi:hypothetical protein
MSLKSFALPRPQLGDKMYKFTLTKQVEECLVVSIIGPPDNPEYWSATLLTKNGVEFVGSDREYRGRHDWVPITWMFDEERKVWVAPLDDGASRDADKVDWNVPAPKAGEKYMSWRARVFREIPALKKDAQATEILSDVWKSKSSDSVEAAEA